MKEISPKERENGATQGLPRRSPILVLLSPKHTWLQSFDGIWCINIGMITPTILLQPNPLMWYDWDITSGVLDKKKKREKFVLTGVLLCKYLGCSSRSD